MFAEWGSLHDRPQLASSPPMNRNTLPLTLIARSPHGKCSVASGLAMACARSSASIASSPDSLADRAGRLADLAGLTAGLPGFAAGLADRAGRLADLAGLA